MVPKPHPLPNGLVIMFEGVDGAGKTTQLELVQAALEDAGWPVMVTRNMGGTPIGEALRKVIKSSAERPPMTDFYISLAVQEPLLALIDEARRAGKVVLMDRGPLSLAAYQIYGTGIDAELGWRHVDAAMSRIKSEAIILYEADPQMALARKQTDRPDHFESKPAEYFQRVTAGYQAAVGRFRDATTVIDAAPPAETVATQTLAVVNSLLKTDGSN